jgi:transcription elongation factor GreB
MSRAFVKESDADPVDELPDLPQSPHPNYITSAGLQHLRERLAALRLQRRSLDEQAGDDMAQNLPRGSIERDIRYLEGRIERAIEVDPATQGVDRVYFGNAVTVADAQDRHLRFVIVGEDEADTGRGLVSWASPLGRALLGGRAGDVVSWRRPSGATELEVIEITHPAPDEFADAPSR